MFCVYCGAKDAANFCVTCGRAQPTNTKPALPITLIPDAPLSSEQRVEAICDQAIELASELTPTTPPPLPIRFQAEQTKTLGGGDWVLSIDYETVLHAAVPRERIAMATRRVKAGIGGEDLLKLFDKVSPYGIPLAKINNAVLPLYEKLGIKTGQQVSMSFIAPAGHVMLAVLCTLAERGLGISDVQQASSHCTLVAEVPLGFITNRGRLIISLQSQPAGQIDLAIATEILGQMWDWGRSKRLSDELVTAIKRELNTIAMSAAYRSGAA